MLHGERFHIPLGIRRTASRCPYVANSQWLEDVAGKHIAAAAATLVPDVVSAAQELGRARDLCETAEELLKELGDKASDA
jgi:hypothetical protein